MANNKCLVLVCSVIVLFCLPNPAIPGSFTDYIKSECPSEFKKHKKTVKEFAIRMKPYIEDCGCGIVNLYASISDKNMELIEQLEEDLNLMQAFIPLFEISDDLNEAIKFCPDIVEIYAIFNSDNRSSDLLIETLTSFSRHDVRQLKRNPNYIYYYLLAIEMSTDRTNALQLIKKVKQLKKTIPVEYIDLFSIAYAQARNIYPDAGSDYWVNVADQTLKVLGPDSIQAIRPYKENLSYFFPPRENEIPESQNRTYAEIQRLKKDYMELIAHIFRNISNSYGLPRAIKVVENISTSITEALLYYQNRRQIQRYLDYDFDSQRFRGILKNGICQSATKDEGLKKYFSMYSPYKNGHPLRGTEGNLGLIAKWFSEGNLKSYINKADNVGNYVYSMAVLPHIFATLSPKQKTVFNDLLFNLSDAPTLNAILIAALFENTDYFSWIETKSDAFSTVKHNPEVIRGKSARKYKYILITSYPKDSSDSVSDLFGNNESISSAALYHLMSMSIDELEEHNFTNTERYLAVLGSMGTIIEVADYTMIGVSILAIPLTVGASAGVTAMLLARKGAVSGVKKSIKALGKRTLKSSFKLIGKQGSKVARREFKEVFLKTAQKRGRKIVMEEAMKKGIKRTSRVTDRLDQASMLAVSGVAIAHLLANGPGSTEPLDLCEEINLLREGE